MFLSERDYMFLFTTLYAGHNKKGIYTTKDLISETQNNLGIILDFFKVNIIKDGDKSAFTEDKYPQVKFPETAGPKVVLEKGKAHAKVRSTEESKSTKQNKKEDSQSFQGIGGTKPIGEEVKKVGKKKGRPRKLDR